MDYLKQLSQKTTVIIYLNLLFFSVLAGLSYYFLDKYVTQDTILLYSCLSLVLIILITLFSLNIKRIVLKPISRLSDVIVYAGHNARGGAPPIVDDLRLGRELVASLSRQVYDLKDMSTESRDTIEETPQQSLDLLDQINLPIIGIDSTQKIIKANNEATRYLNRDKANIVDMQLYDVVSMQFDVEETFEIWLKNSQQNTAVNTKSWDHVRLINHEGKVAKSFDLVASFSNSSSSGIETILTFYDKTKQYSSESSQLGFVTLAVHELRTPLSIMKGYIEVFEDELGPKLDPEMQDFMHKMKASSQQLNEFVTNILNVARVEENQLSLKLTRNGWSRVLKDAVTNLELRAKVYGKHIELDIADNLPDVAVDQINITGVINNLVDNAIKYSKNSNRIIIKSYLNTDGLVETSIQDFGVGIPQNVIPELFRKYYRSFKSKNQIQGTGIGLYISKAILTAHDGNIWVRSKEGEGSTFTFTLQPYDHVQHENNSDDGIIRGAHGWIKNHSMNRQ